MNFSKLFTSRQKYRQFSFMMILAISSVSFASQEQDLLNRSVQKVINDIKSAKSMESANAALEGFAIIIQKYSSDKTLQAKASLCQSLETLTTDDLTLIENDLTSLKENGLIKICDESLHSKLKKHWDKQIASLPNKDNFYQAAADGNIGFRVTEKYIDTTNAGPYRWQDYQTKQITLTFDDGPDISLTPKVLDTLSEFGAKGVFFELGQNVKRYPEVSKRLVQEGHSLGSHTYSHKELSKIQKNKGIESAQQEILFGQQTILDAVGSVKPFFRFPYGADTPELKRWLWDNEIETFRWNIDTLDWKTTNVNDLIANTKTYIEQAGNKGVLLMHDVHNQSLLALPYILQYLQEQGYEIILPVAKDQVP